MAHQGRRLALALPWIVAALVFFGCSDGVPTVAAAPVREVAELTGFTSPSGNIGCYIDPSSVRCDIRERSWAPPPHPAYCPDYTDYGQGLTIRAGGPSEFVCAGDTALAGGPALSYGDSITAGVLRCDSAETGITCRDVQTAHGFSISRERYQLF
jgi:hypothetical protein